MNMWGFIFGSQELIVSSVAICGVFSLLNILYPKFKNIKIITHFIYTTTQNIVNQYAFRAHFLLFFLFIFYIILTNNILSIFSFPTLFSKNFTSRIALDFGILTQLILVHFLIFSEKYLHRHV